MNIIQISLILQSCIYLSNAIGLYGLLNTYKLFLKELKETLQLYDVSPTIISWIEQPLDHFDEKENRTWYMRYFKRLDYWKEKGPIYLLINGESMGSDFLLSTGTLCELAKETNGAMYATEHRYYGKSQPFRKLTTKNLAYLSARQALADAADLIREIKLLPQYNESKVVVVGGSYAGNLAAWMRLLYPELVDAAISSSAPVLAKKDFYEYLERVSFDFEQYGGSGCYQSIRKMFNRYDELFKTPAGIEELIKEEQICNTTDMSKPENKQVFFLDKATQFMYEAQYGNTDSIRNFCHELLSYNNNDSNSLKFSSKDDDDFIFWSTQKSCYDYEFDDMIKGMNHYDWITAWTYQTCTEFGYFISTSSPKHPFTDNVPVDLYYSICTKMFGEEFDEARINEGIKKVNELYKGLKPNVTHVVFVNGELDPWARLGILEDLSYEAPAKVIPRSSHCRDLLSDIPEDPEELKQARLYIKHLIKRWIGVGEYKNPI